MTSKPGKQATAIRILPYILRNEDNQTMKFGQLIKQNSKNIFLKKLQTKCDGKMVQTLFKKIKIEHISG